MNALKGIRNNMQHERIGKSIPLKKKGKKKGKRECMQ